MKCRWFQFLINRSLDDGRPLSPNTQRHLADCARCHDFWRQQSRLIDRFQQNKKEVTGTEPGPFLRSRVMNRIKAEQPSATPAGVNRWMWGGLAVSAVVLMVALVPVMKPVSVNNQAAKNRTEVVSVALLEKTSRFTSGGNLLQAATNIDQPLHQELNLVISDAQNALRSLRQEFVPSQLLAKGD